MRRYIILFTLIAVGAAAIGVATVGVLPVAPATDLIVEPKVFDCATDPEQGEFVSVPLMIRNPGATATRIVSVSGSCGCMQLTAREQAAFNGPVDLVGGDVLPIIARVNTSARIGPSEFTVTVRADNGAGRKTIAESLIRMNVRHGWSAVPPMLIFHDIAPGERVTGAISIVDSLPDPGVKVKQIIPSNSDSLSTEVQIPKSPNSTGGPEAVGADPLIRKRVQINVTLVPRGDAVRGEESIVVVPVDENRPSLRIPIFYTLKSPPYRISPPTLVVANVASGDRVVRTISCEPRSVDGPLVRLLRGPPFAEVTVRAVEHGRQEIVVTLTAPHDDIESELVFTADPTGAVAFTIPIRFYR